MPTTNAKDPGRNRRPLNQKPKTHAVERNRERRERQSQLTGALNFAVRVKPGRCLLGIDKKTRKDRAAAFKFEGDTPHGRIKGWVIEQDGNLTKIVPNWDAAERFMREQGLSVRLARATG